MKLLEVIAYSNGNKAEGINMAVNLETYINAQQKKRKRRRNYTLLKIQVSLANKICKEGTKS